MPHSKKKKKKNKGKNSEKKKVHFPTGFHRVLNDEDPRWGFEEGDRTAFRIPARDN